MAIHQTVTALIVLASVLASLVICLQIAKGHSVKFNAPVGSSQQDEIISLPNLNHSLNFKQYSGYLEADREKRSFLHYWLVESQSDPDKDPLVLWLNGGPGCSSLIGLFIEHGPFLLNKHNQLVENKFSWNKRANVLYLESPAGVGFSFSASGNKTANDFTTALQNFRALKSFFKKFPKFENRSLYLTGESYAGVYLPTLAYVINHHDTMNLKGLAIGNGYMDSDKNRDGTRVFAYHHGLLSPTIWNGLVEHCCGGKTDERGYCREETPRSRECLEFHELCYNSIRKLGINPYNIYADCTRSKEKSGQEDPEEIPCYGFSNLADYLNLKSVREALHISDQSEEVFAICAKSRENFYRRQMADQEGGVSKIIESLIKSERRLKIISYNGDSDLVVSFIGNRWFVDDLNDTLVADYQPWFMPDGQVGGFIKEFKSITFMTVKGSGHSVPVDKPAEALHLFEKYLLGLPSIN